MKIGVDVRTIQPFPTGIGNYREGLIKALAKVGSGHEFVLVGNRGSKMEDWCEDRPRFSFAVVRSPANSVWQHFLLPWELGKLNLDLFWTTPWGAVLFLPCPYALTIYDLLYRRYPQYMSLKAQLYERLLSRRIAQRAKVIFTISDFVKKDMVESLKVNEEKVFNIRGAAGEAYRLIEDREFKNRVLKEYKIEKPFLVYLGNLRPHKNLPRLLEAFAKFCKARPCGVSLAIIGDVDAKGRNRDSARLLTRIGHLKLQDRVVLTGRIKSNRKVAAILNAAVALVHPSLHEGFGLTVLEALSCGCPVVTSKTSSLPEVCGEAAIYVEPNDTSDIARGISQILGVKDTPEYSMLREKALNQAKKFSWEETAGKALEVLDKIEYENRD